MRERPDENLYDLQELLTACRKHLSGTELNSDERNRIAVVASGIERMLEQRPEAGSSDIDVR